jgi:hypothetical protein
MNCQPIKSLAFSNPSDLRDSNGPLRRAPNHYNDRNATQEDQPAKVCILT